MTLNKLKKYKLVLLLSFICLITTLYWIFYSPYGANNFSEINNEIEILSSDINSLESQNKQLKDEINKLKRDNEYIEDIARKEYGLLKKNEIVFQFKGKK